MKFSQIPWFLFIFSCTMRPVVWIFYLHSCQTSCWTKHIFLTFTFCILWQNTMHKLISDCISWKFNSKTYINVMCGKFIFIFLPFYYLLPTILKVFWHPEKIIIWRGLHTGSIIRPYFFETENWFQIQTNQDPTWWALIYWDNFLVSESYQEKDSSICYLNMWLKQLETKIRCSIGKIRLTLLCRSCVSNKTPCIIEVYSFSRCRSVQINYVSLCRLQMLCKLIYQTKTTPIKTD